MDLGQLARPGYWFDGSPGPATTFTYALVGLFVLLLAASLTLWLLRRRLFAGQRVKTRLAARLGPWAVAASGIGLAATGLRVVEVPILSARVLWLLSLLGVVGLVAYVGWYWQARYPAERARIEHDELQQRVMPRPRPRRRTERRRR